MLHGENVSVTFNLAVEVIDGAFSLAVEVINEMLTPEVSHLIQCKMLYSVFTINVPLAVRFATVAIGMRKAESPEYGRFDRDLH